MECLRMGLRAAAPIAAVAGLVAGFAFTAPVQAAETGFPFGLEIMLDVPPMQGSERIPTIEIGDNGELRLDLWCKSGRGQFSVAGDTIIFVPGPMKADGCTPPRAQADDELLANLSAVTNWTRQGVAVTLRGPKALKFRITTN